MTFDQKIELIKFADCNVSDVKKILDILSDNNIEIDNKLSGTDFLQSLSDNLLKCYDNERDQDKKLYDFFYYNKIETYSKFRLENEEEDDDEEDNDEDDDDFYLGYKED